MSEKHGGFHLVTGDGSINCVDVPGEQEAVTLDLHMQVSCEERIQKRIPNRRSLQEAIIALDTLVHGGAFVCKRFTLLERRSLGSDYANVRSTTTEIRFSGLLAMLIDLFNTVIACKPEASRPANSEIYLLFIDFDQQRYKSAQTHWQVSTSLLWAFSVE